MEPEWTTPEWTRNYYTSAVSGWSVNQTQAEMIAELVGKTHTSQKEMEEFLRVLLDPSLDPANSRLHVDETNYYVPVSEDEEAEVLNSIAQTLREQNERD